MQLQLFKWSPSQILSLKYQNLSLFFLYMIQKKSFFCGTPGIEKKGKHKGHTCKDDDESWTTNSFIKTRSQHLIVAPAKTITKVLCTAQILSSRILQEDGFGIVYFTLVCHFEMYVTLYILSMSNTKMQQWSRLSTNNSW